ncbi:MAG: PIG-L family deacetylase [Chloroflexi bacterium]|nr:PIG-L family deacetylase [Chloroflexota bacterium]
MTLGEADARPEHVLVVLAHPDDPEFFCGGTLALWAQQGWAIDYCLLTRGDKGADDAASEPVALAQLREQEQRAAAAVLGVRSVRFLDQPDGYLTPDLALRKQVVRILRQVRPDIVVTCDPTNFFPSDRYINHPDHRAAGQATLDAVFPASGSALFFPELLSEEGLQPHRIRQVYVAMPQTANTLIDVTGTLERKIAALREHRSQIPDQAGLEARIRERLLDPASPPEAPRYVERFRLIDLGR